MFSKYCQDKEPDLSSMEPLPSQFQTGRRTSVSAECWMQACDPYKCANTARLPPKSGTRAASALLPRNSPNSASSTSLQPDLETQVAARLASSLRNTIFFQELGDDLMSQVLNALRRTEIAAGIPVIQQGDEGDDLYVLDSGRVEFVQNGTRIGEANAPTTFGELALLYNTKRKATVRTLDDSVVYTLDRITFKQIMVAKLSRKRVHSQQVLASIDIFSGLSEATQLKIADALHPASYVQGDIVIRQGESGYDFFLIDEGTVDVSVDGEIVASLSSGSYFGEIALIYDLPRAATVTVTSAKLKVESLSSRGFEQLIGPSLLAELRKRDPRRP